MQPIQEHWERNKSSNVELYLCLVKFESLPLPYSYFLSKPSLEHNHVFDTVSILDIFKRKKKKMSLVPIELWTKV